MQLRRMVLCVLFVMLWLCVPVAVLAQEAVPTPAGVDLATRVIVVAGIVATVVQGIKKIFPAIGGPVAIVLNVVAALAGTYAAAPAGANVLGISFLIQAAGSAFMAHGVHALASASKTG